MANIPVRKLVDQKEVWFEQETLVSMIAAAVEFVDVNEKREVKGILYGKKVKAPQKQKIFNRFTITRAYPIQEAERLEDKVTTFKSTIKKLNTFIQKNTTLEYLGTFHSHPGGSKALSPTDMDYFNVADMKFLVAVEVEPKLRPRQKISFDYCDENYEELQIICNAKIRRYTDKSKKSYRMRNVTLRFTVLGWYCYKKDGQKARTPVRVFVS